MQASKVYHTLAGRQLWDWYWITITYDANTGTKHVHFHTLIHVRKEVILPVGFAGTFTDEQILNDSTVHKQISERWGNVTAP